MQGILCDAPKQLNMKYYFVLTICELHLLKNLVQTTFFFSAYSGAECEWNKIKLETQWHYICVGYMDINSYGLAGCAVHHYNHQETWKKRQKHPKITHQNTSGKCS